jgi:ubiquinone/menaquinone biosynthesis C-methylase UbiE
MRAEKDMNELVGLLGEAIPNDWADQVDLQAMVRSFSRLRSHPMRVLDLGCGSGVAVDFLRGLGADLDYIGVDIAASPQSLGRRRTDARFESFDGIHIPLADDHVDLVYCNQVFEHVRHPDALAADIARVLKPGGQIIASVSFLEPYHSYSLFNFSPLAVKEVMTDAGLDLQWIRPGIDGIALSMRHVAMQRVFDRYMRRLSPANRLAKIKGRLRKESPRQINARMLEVAGYIVFAASKP